MHNSLQIARKCNLALALALLGRAEGDREGDDELPECLSGLTLLSSARPLRRRYEDSSGLYLDMLVVCCTIHDDDLRMSRTDLVMPRT